MVVSFQCDRDEIAGVNTSGAEHETSSTAAPGFDDNDNNDNVETFSNDDHADDDEEAFIQARRKSYPSRVEQILDEDSDMPILITQATKNSDSGNYIVYTIKTGVGRLPVAFIDN